MAETTDAKPSPEAAPGDRAFLDGVHVNYEAAISRERDNIREGYEDLRFIAAEQWDENIKRQREDEGRPCLTENRLPQFCRQITGDIRQMRPAIKVVPVDNRADPDTAKVIAGITRYVENRSMAQAVYFQGADGAVQAGRGAWRVTTEYASDTTFDQEIRIAPIEDGLSVVWDPDANLPGKTDAMFCFVSVDISTRAFEAKYPGKSASSFGDDYARTTADWYGEDWVRVAEYWYKEPVERTFLVGGGELKEIEPDEMADAEAFVRIAMGRGDSFRIEKRKGFKVMRAVVTGCEVLEEPSEWPGRYIPVVTVDGEEIRIGRRVVRHGAVRNARDPQRRLNYFLSAETETIALQPKSPFVGTSKQFEGFEDQWENANRENRPYLEYNADPQAGGPPQRQQPPVSSQGIAVGLQGALAGLQATTGIYNSSLGAASNETSGKAITARQREGDTGTYVYVEHFSQAIAVTAKIVVDLIPRVYDTTRQMRIIGEDGDEELVEINKPTDLAEMPDGGDGDAEAIQRILNDVTVGSYDVVVEMGPSYNTRREEARDGMIAFLQAAPQAAPLVLDLIAKMQDWPLADDVRERLETLLPPEVKAKQAEKRGEPPPAEPPNPAAEAAAMQARQEAEAAAAKQAVEMEKLGLEREKLAVERERLRVEMAKIEASVMTAAAVPAAANDAGRPAAVSEPAPVEPVVDPRVDELAGTVRAIDAALGEVLKALAAAGVIQMPGMTPPANDPGLVEQPPAPVADLSALDQPEATPIAA